LNKKLFHYLSIIFSLFYFTVSSAQDLTLKISSFNKTELSILDKLDYVKSHKDISSVHIEIEKISNFLKNQGYFTNRVLKTTQENKNYVVYFSLNMKIENVILKINSESEIHFEKSKIKKGTISIPIKELQSTLSNISKKLDEKGRSFSKIQLKNIVIRNNSLYTDLEITQSKKRLINKVILKGYKNFPKSYLKNYFNLTINTVFNQQKINKLSKDSKNLQFATETKRPEVLFTKDSTLVYMYLKKAQNNSFDGLVNLSTKENGGVLFNGHIDLKLNNTLNKGEKLELLWNSIDEERQEFRISTEIPYIFNSAFTPEISFLLYKQDSSFINSKFITKIKYNINNQLKIGINYNSESSESLSSKNDINGYHSRFIGFHLFYSKQQNDLFQNNKFYLEINPFFGNRKTKNTSSNQFKIKTITSYIWDISNRASLYIKNEIGFLSSDTYINNELFRIGGANSIRGFNEQSIFTKNYTFFNIEYRYLTSKKSYFYTITDFGKIKEKNNNLLSLGLGYLFRTNNSQININTSLEKNPQKSINLNATKLIVSWKNIF